MKQGFLQINGVLTNVQTCGRWVEEVPEVNEQQDDIILVIPGNPGIVSFYDQFMRLLHEKTKKPVWIISHAGHDVPKDPNEPDVPLKSHLELFGMEGQIKHKEEFISKYVPQKARIHLIGHSSGCYIILRLLKIPSMASRVVHSYLLFPTIERITETKNGIFCNKIISNFVGCIVFFSWIYNLLPKTVSLSMLSIYMKIESIPKVHVKPITSLIQPGVLEKVFFMGIPELSKVSKRDDDIINDNIDKLTLVYGKTDNWAPPSYYEKIKKDIPKVKAFLTNFHHEFILNENEEMADLVGNWICGTLSKLAIK